MLDLKRKNKGIQKVYLKVIIVILAIFVLFAGNATWNLYLKYREAKFNRDITQNELKKLQKREKVILSELDKLNTDRGIEGELRKKFGIVRKGEKVIVIINPKLDKANSGDDIEKQNFSIWNKFLNLFSSY